MIFSLPAGNSRRRRRLKNPGAVAPGFTGVWGRSATNKHAPGIYRRIACHYHYATTTTINFTLTLQYLSFDFYTAAVFFSRTQKSKGDI